MCLIFVVFLHSLGKSFPRYLAISIGLSVGCHPQMWCTTKKNPFGIAEDLFTSPHLFNVNIYAWTGPPKIPHSSTERRRYFKGTIHLSWFLFTFVLLQWIVPDMHSTNVGLHTDAHIWVRRIPGSHVGVLVHIYVLGLEVIKTSIIYLSTLIK